MGYRIEYKIGQEYVKTEILTASVSPVIKNTLWLIVGGILVHLLTVGVQMAILTPREDVRAAAQQMITEVRNGQNLDAAIETFYETVSE